MDWHPLLVHYPIALWPVGFAVDLVAWVAKREEWHGFAYLLQALGAVAALAAVLSGNDAAGSYRDESGVQALIERHEDLATLTLVLFLVVVLGRLPLHLQKRLCGWKLKAWILAAGVGSGLVWVTGHYGGELVYEQGVGVGQYEKLHNERGGANDAGDSVKGR